MKKNKIGGVRPFNDFFFRSCYYHQLMAGLASFGIDDDAILLNTFRLIQNDFSVAKEGCLNEKKLEKELGYEKRHCNINEAKLIRCIDKGYPIIMGIDCYYLESRKDTYQIQHFSHFILVYGYDLDSREVNVIDHEYRNSYNYQEKIISLDNLLLANVMFQKGIFNRKHSCYVLKKKRNIGTFNIWKYIDEETINKNRENSSKNLNELRQIIACDLGSAQENVEKIAEYLNELKTFYYTLSKTKFFIVNQEKQDLIIALGNAYSNILSLFWKLKVQNDYNYITKHLESILRKLDEIERLEKAVYDILLEEQRKK